MIQKIYNIDCYIGLQHLKDKSIDLILTDPPYNTTNFDFDCKINLEKLWNEYHRVIKDNGAILIFGVEPFSSRLRTSNLKYYKYDWFWSKSHTTGFLNAWKQPLRKIETISVFYKKQCNYYPIITDKDQKNIRPITRGKNSKCYNNYEKKFKLPLGKSLPTNLLNFNVHNPAKRIFPTQKPIPLLEYFIKTYTKENELVLDSFMGSGSVIEACINLNRQFVGMEIDSNIFEIAKNRIGSDYIGNTNS
jgi:DNA modification methylase